MPVKHGGKRRNAGRKSEGEIQHARTLIDDAVSDAQWSKIFKGLAAAAIDGDSKCAALLMAYRFGLPTQRIAGDDALPPIRIVNVFRNERFSGDSERGD